MHSQKQSAWLVHWLSPNTGFVLGKSTLLETELPETVLKLPETELLHGSSCFLALLLFGKRKSRVSLDESMIQRNPI